MTKAFVFDTYAILAILNGVPAYAVYWGSEVIINHFIFAELCYNTLKISREKSEEAVRDYKKHISILPPRLIFNAMVFRFNNRKKDMSMADCVSYIQAQTLGVPFLTGDSAFEGMPGVEFVK